MGSICDCLGYRAPTPPKDEDFMPIANPFRPTPAQSSVKVYELLGRHPVHY